MRAAALAIGLHPELIHSHGHELDASGSLRIGITPPIQAHHALEDLRRSMVRHDDIQSARSGFPPSPTTGVAILPLSNNNALTLAEAQRIIATVQLSKSNPKLTHIMTYQNVLSQALGYTAKSACVLSALKFKSE